MSFSELVKEAFIDPLRSVLIVDDQYPTWEDILNDHFDASSQDDTLRKQSEAKNWRKNPADPNSVIEQFRRREPGLVIDIHDGVKPNYKVEASHLHQSDLLVLDYNLEGESFGGEKARKILQTVLKNQHFNLIVVHTGEDSLDDVMFECLFSMMSSCTSQFNNDFTATLDALSERLDEFGDGDDFDRNLLSEKLSPEMYFSLRRSGSNVRDVQRQFMRSIGEFGALGEWAKSAGLKNKELKDFFYWAIREFEKPRENMFSVDTFDGLSWKNGSDFKWMRTSKGFVTFVKKGSNDLLLELQNAIESWKPTPSRLISAKYRHELTKAGAVAEDRTLQKKHVFAHFYKDFCSPARQDLTISESDRLRNMKLKAYVARQSEEISFYIEDEVARFGEKIKQIDEKNTGNFSSHYNVDLTVENSEESREAIRQYNSYVSTLPLKIPDDQLDSGHIFKLDSDWWICATPACDLQPGQTTIGFVGSSSSLRPFTALRLLPINNHSDLTRNHINSGLYCFVEDNPGNVICLGLQEVEPLESKEKNKEVTIDNGKVIWRMYLALDNGSIVDSRLELSIPKINDDRPVFEQKEARVVSKLRYEYALNYIQKVGVSVSRIGLGYLS